MTNLIVLIEVIEFSLELEKYYKNYVKYIIWVRLGVVGEKYKKAGTG